MTVPGVAPPAFCPPGAILASSLSTAMTFSVLTHESNEESRGYSSRQGAPSDSHAAADGVDTAIVKRRRYLRNTSVMTLNILTSLDGMALMALRYWRFK